MLTAENPGHEIFITILWMLQPSHFLEKNIRFRKTPDLLQVPQRGGNDAGVWIHHQLVIQGQASISVMLGSCGDPQSL